VSLIFGSHRFDERDKATDINRLDRPTRRNRHCLRDGGMLEYYVASARLADVDAMRGGDLTTEIVIGAGAT
jgi:hypothetical protein